MRKYSYLIMIIMSLMGELFSNNSQKIQEMHKEIGELLISLRKELPQAQGRVYSLLDLVGKMHDKAQAICQSHTVLEEKLQQKEATLATAIKEHTELKSKFMQARGEVEQLGKKLAAQQAEQEKKAEQKKLLDEKKAAEAPKESEVALHQLESDFKQKLFSKIQSKKNDTLVEYNV